MKLSGDRGYFGRLGLSSIIPKSIWYLEEAKFQIDRLLAENGKHSTSAEAATDLRARTRVSTSFSVLQQRFSSLLSLINDYESAIEPIRM